MTLRLGKMADWMFIDSNDELTFAGVEPRLVKAEFRSEVRQSVYIDEGDGQKFLFVLDGYENVEFTVGGPFALYSDGPLYVKTADSSYVHSDNTDEEIFTKMHEKRAIAPEIAAMQRVMAINMERLKADMRRDMEGMRRATERQARRDAEALSAALAASAGAGEETPPEPEPPAKKGGAGAEKKATGEGDAPKK